MRYFPNWLSFFRRQRPTLPRRQAPRRTFRPCLETLEDRLTPATHIWVGPASGGLWSNAVNWTNGIPLSGEAGGTIVQFNGGIDSIQDYKFFLTVDEIHFTAGGSTIRSALGQVMGISGNLPVSILNDAGTNTLDASLPLDITTANPILVQATSGQLNVNSDLFGGKSGITVAKMSAGTVTLGGNINLTNNAPNSSVSVNGGTLSLTGNSPNDQGITQADNSTLVVNGSYPNSPLDFLSNATLAGTGTVQSISTIFGLGNVVSPGGAGAIGTLTIAPGTTTSKLKGSTLQVDVTSSSAADQLIVGNGATLDLTDAMLSLNVLGSAGGNIYTIIRSATGEFSGTIKGTFAGLADGSTLSAGGRTFRINYTANAVTLTDLASTGNNAPPPPSVSVAFGPQGEVLALVSPSGVLTLFDAAGAHVQGGGVRSASLAFGPNGLNELITFQDGTLELFDATGGHVLSGGVRSASLAFGPNGLNELVTFADGTLFLANATGGHVLGGGVQSASLAFGPTGQVIEAVTLDGTLIQADASGAHVLGGGGGSILSAGVAFAPGGAQVLDVIFSDLTLLQVDATGSHNFGKLA
jgi:hypothetical protein